MSKGGVFSRAWRTGLASLLLAACVVSLQASARPASAQADYCSPNTETGFWYCYMEGYIPPATPQWFNLGNNNRNWFLAQIGDAYGGTVSQKCAHIMRASDGYREQIVCGPGAPAGYVNSWMKPGYIFQRHGAPGWRTIGTVALSPYYI